MIISWMVNALFLLLLWWVDEAHRHQAIQFSIKMNVNWKLLQPAKNPPNLCIPTE